MKLKKLWLIAPAVLGIAIVPTILASCAGLEQKTEGTLTPPPSTDDNNGNTTTLPTTKPDEKPSEPNETTKIKTFEIYYTSDGVHQQFDGHIYIRGYESKEKLANFISSKSGSWINFEKLSMENQTSYKEIYRAKWMANNFKLDSIKEIPYKEWIIYDEI